jgi:hypothetical protein
MSDVHMLPVNFPSEAAIAAAIDSFVQRPQGKNQNWNRRDMEAAIRAAFAVDFPSIAWAANLTDAERGG